MRLNEIDADPEGKSLHSQLRRCNTDGRVSRTFRKLLSQIHPVSTGVHQLILPNLRPRLSRTTFLKQALRIHHSPQTRAESRRHLNDSPTSFDKPVVAQSPLHLLYDIPHRRVLAGQEGRGPSERETRCDLQLVLLRSGLRRCKEGEEGLTDLPRVILYG